MKIFTVFIAVFFLLIACREPKPKQVSVEGIKKSVQLDKQLFCSQPSEEGLKNLAEMGYKTVLSTRGKNEVKWDEAAVAGSLGMAFINIPMPGPVQEITDEQVKRFDEAMSSAQKPIALHCGSGNRVSGLWAVWLVEYKNVPKNKALELAAETGMKSVRTAVEKRLGI